MSRPLTPWAEPRGSARRRARGKGWPFAFAALFFAACAAVRHFEVAPVSLSAARVTPRGEALLSELNCVACHEAAPEVLERLQPKSAPDLERVGARRSPEWIRRFLTDPQATQPGTSMPVDSRRAISASL